MGTFTPTLIVAVYCFHIYFVLPLRCGHDDVEYDIFKNDEIEPIQPYKSRFSNPSKLTSTSTRNGATKWLKDEIDESSHRKSVSSHDNADDMQTFSSRKNTKPHHHHDSPYAFKHNIHHRHHPDDEFSKVSDPVISLNNQETEALDKSVWKPFRIHYNSDELVSAWSDKEEANHFAENVIPAAIHYLERSLYVRPVEGKLKLSRPCMKYVVDTVTGKRQCVELKWNWQQCGGHVTIPQTDLEDTVLCELDESNPKGYSDCKTMKGGEGHDADIIIYFSGDSDFGCNDVYGFSAYCHSNKYDRPIAGFVNLCEATLVQPNRIFTWEQKVTLVVHEVFHVLGFSSTGFAYFRFNDENRTPRTPRSKVDGSPLKKHGQDHSEGGYAYGSNTIQYHHVRGKPATFIVLPTVVKYAKRFFECDDVIGIELEDFGGHDTAASHWEQRILGYEFMIGYIPPAAPFSVFSFAVLEDSGWYKVNWKYASQHPYGRKFGCDWIDEKCLSEGAQDMLDPLTFCNSDVDYGCSKDHIAISNCQIEEYKFDLADYFRYFDGKQNKNVGGRLEYADYCPMYYHYNNGDCRFVDASIKHKRFGATITPQSKCVMISHPDHHYLNLKMQGFDGSAIVEEDQMRKERALEREAERISGAAQFPFGGFGHQHHHRRKPLPKELGVCYKQECITRSDYEWVGLRIEVWNMEYEESEWITCWKGEDDGKYKITQLHEYDIRCPVNEDICYDNNPWLCNGHGMLDRKTMECVCNAGYIGCDCLHDDTAENREKYPYSDHVKCQQFNVEELRVFEPPPLHQQGGRGNHERVKQGGFGGLDIFHDIIWNEIDVHFGAYSMVLRGLKMDLKSSRKFVGHSKDEKMNLDFIQIVQSVKLLVAIPLNIEMDKVWVEHYRISKSRFGNERYDLQIALRFSNQQRMAMDQLSYRIERIFHKMFGEEVLMERIESFEGGKVEDARLDYVDRDDEGEEEIGSLSVAPPRFPAFNSGSERRLELSHSVFVICLAILYSTCF